MSHDFNYGGEVAFDEKKAKVILRAFWRSGLHKKGDAASVVLEHDAYWVVVPATGAQYAAVATGDGWDFEVVCHGEE